MPALDGWNDLRRCCIEVMEDKDVLAKYPEGLQAKDILSEIRVKHGDKAFALVSILDVCDEMIAVYGRGRQPKVDQTSEKA